MREKSIKHVPSRLSNKRRDGKVFFFYNKLGNGDNTLKLHNKVKNWYEISIGKQNNQQIFIWQNVSLSTREKYEEKGPLCSCQSSHE